MKSSCAAGKRFRFSDFLLLTSDFLPGLVGDYGAEVSRMKRVIVALGKSQPVGPLKLLFIAETFTIACGGLAIVRKCVELAIDASDVKIEISGVKTLLVTAKEASGESGVLLQRSHLACCGHGSAANELLGWSQNGCNNSEKNYLQD